MSINAFFEFLLSAMSAQQGAPQPAAGVQVLLDAEKEANRLVAAARQYRTDRLRAARSEAALELAALKDARARDYAEVESRLMAELQAGAQTSAAELEAAMAEMRRETVARVDAASALLVRSVCDVRPSLHPNAAL
jgi:V-type H+-transporting ATPase subunit G